MSNTQQPTRIGILGCGNISGHYFEGCAKFSNLKIVACADLDASRARAVAEKYGVEAEQSPDSLAARDDIEIVVNLTVPAAHAETSIRLLEAGKNVYCEKPFALSVSEGEKVLSVAERQGRLICSAPANFLAAICQTARRLVDSGAVGRPVAATSFWANRGPEAWHPAPESFYAASAGPMWDTGPYSLADVLNYFGAISAATVLPFSGIPERECLHPALEGKKFISQSPTHVVALLETSTGVLVNLTTSFDIRAHRVPFFEIYGTDGTLNVGMFAAASPVLLLKTRTDSDWREIKPDPGPTYAWGIGVHEMALALTEGTESRVHARRALHLLEVMECARSKQQCRQVMRTRADRPQPFLQESFGSLGV